MVAEVPSRQAKKTSVQFIWQNDLAQTFTVSLDVAETESLKLAAAVTDHPIERGKNAADHVRPELLHIDVVGTVSNTPIVVPLDNADGARAVRLSIDGAGRTVGQVLGRPLPVLGAILAPLKVNGTTEKASVLAFVPAFDRVGAVVAAFRQLNEDGSLVTIVSTYGTFENFALESVAFDRDAQVGIDATTITISAKEVRIGRTLETQVPLLPTKKIDKGKKPTKPADASPENESMLHSLFGDDTDEEVE